MAHDERGNIYATYREGIVVVNPEGKLIGVIPVPEHPANCAFGGNDNKTLYITARTSLYAVDMKVAGMALQSFGGGVEAREVKVNTLVLSIPVNWKQEQPANRMRLAQFKIPAIAGDTEAAELVVSHFGPARGLARANVSRWIGQFEEAGRRVKVVQGRRTGGKYILVDVIGTYNKSVGPFVRGQKKRVPGSRMLAAIVDASIGPYFLKLTGPEKTVSAALDGFRASFSGKAESEEPMSF